ncbi:hypothetical protein [Aliiruegeria lutimaris]|uniref:hypothetical protein n=1 Tax=Aliiruegeria lutimaris TaxID=571298 RepID=UPI001FCD0D7C|nr:hypothetical protein [Aliiruegeria lutimaris]
MRKDQERVHIRVILGDQVEILGDRCVVAAAEFWCTVGSPNASERGKTPSV